MDPVAIASLIEEFTTLATTLTPKLIALGQGVKAATTADTPELDAALAKIQPMNDALHAQVQGLT